MSLTTFSPLILAWLYRQNFFSHDGLIYLGKCIAGITLIYFGAFYIRGIGRVFNPVYRQFIDILANSSKLNHDSKVFSVPTKNELNFQITKKLQFQLLLSNYDFSFGAWPIDYSVLGR